MRSAPQPNTRQSANIPTKPEKKENLFRLRTRDQVDYETVITEKLIDPLHASFLLDLLQDISEVVLLMQPIVELLFARSQRLRSRHFATFQRNQLFQGGIANESCILSRGNCHMTIPSSNQKQTASMTSFVTHRTLFGLLQTYFSLFNKRQSS